MWDGTFSPELQKRRVESWWIPERHATFDEIDTEEWNEDRMDQMTSEFIEDYDEDFEGTLIVKLGNQKYAWPCTAGEYLDFKKSGFSLAYLNRHFPIMYVGDWGWPYGRDHTSVSSFQGPEGTIFYTKR